jgi:hypothetical protein
MNRPKLSTAVRVAVAVAVVAGALVIVREMFGCTPPRDQADMIELYEADPLIATAPHDGRLVEEQSRSYTCDSGMPHGSSPTGPGFAEVMRRYEIPAAYSLDQLRQRFDEPAAAGGWRIEEARTGPNHPRVMYCKQTGERSSHAYVTSTIYLEDVEDPPVPAVEVRLSASRRDGTKCNVDTSGQ